MRGDPRLGAVLRALRTEQDLTRDVVASQIPCAPAQVSQVESGARALLPWLARRMDRVYGTGTAISALTNPGLIPSGRGCATLYAGDGVVLVRPPEGGVMVPVSRRALLEALGMGATFGVLWNVDAAAAGVAADEQTLAGLTDGLRSFQTAGRILPPGRLVDPLIGQVAVLDTLRRRARRPLRRSYLMLQAEYADYLCRMVQEAGDPAGSVYWVDRARDWAEQAGWPAMTAYTHVRRSILATVCASDGALAVEHARRAFHPSAPVMVRAYAARQMAYGHALAGHPNAAHRALDQMSTLFDAASTQDEESDHIIGLGGVYGDVAGVVARGTCDVYLGGGERAIPLLDSSQAAHKAAAGPGSRHHAITGARLARAYAQAGEPDRACELALAALDAGGAVDSHATRTELGRLAPTLNRWPGREDVAEVRHQITALRQPSAP